MLAWRDLVPALGLVLVIEGALALLSPHFIKLAARAYLAASPGRLRLAGAVAVLVGLAVVAMGRLWL